MTKAMIEKCQKVEALRAAGKTRAEACKEAKIGGASYYVYQKTMGTTKSAKKKSKPHVFVDMQREPLPAPVQATPNVAVILCAPDQLGKVLQGLGQA